MRRVLGAISAFGLLAMGTVRLCTPVAAKASPVTGWGLGAAAPGGCCTATGCNCVFSDEFNGTSLDRTKWWTDQEFAQLYYFQITPPTYVATWCAVDSEVTVSGGF